MKLGHNELYTPKNHFDTQQAHQSFPPPKPPTQLTSSSTQSKPAPPITNKSTTIFTPSSQSINLRNVFPQLKISSSTTEYTKAAPSPSTPPDSIHSILSSTITPNHGTKYDHLHSTHSTCTNTTHLMVGDGEDHALTFTMEVNHQEVTILINHPRDLAQIIAEGM